MIICRLENGNEVPFRHVVTHAIVEKDEKILLGKRSPQISGGGKWGLPGGFLDQGETLEEGVLRELLEETGWKGKIISLFRINSNPDRGPEENRQNVALEFIIKPSREVSKGDHESSELKWFPIDALPPASELAFDHGKTLDLYLKYRKSPHNLPILE